MWHDVGMMALGVVVFFVVVIALCVLCAWRDSVATKKKQAAALAEAERSYQERKAAAEKARQEAREDKILAELNETLGRWIAEVTD